MLPGRLAYRQTYTLFFVPDLLTGKGKKNKFTYLKFKYRPFPQKRCTSARATIAPPNRHIYYLSGPKLINETLVMPLKLCLIFLHDNY